MNNNLHIRKLIREALKQLNDNDIIVETGTELFHGTVEEFPIQELSVGGYDSLLWTTTDSAISQTYIPESSVSVGLNTGHITKPSQGILIPNIQKMFGVNYDYSEVTFDRGRATSYKEAPIFEKASEYFYSIGKQLFEKSQEINKVKEELKNKKYDEATDEDIKTLNKLESEYENLRKKYNEYNLDKIKNKHINSNLRKLGYKPDYERDDTEELKWDLKVNNNELQPADYKSPGRLLIIKPKRDLKIYDATNAGKLEGDLMDLDYHKHEWFEKAKELGYDGIQINDFAQSVDMGNFGHKAIGLFKDTIKDVSIKEIPAVHQELESHYKSRDYESPEYKEYKKLS